MFRAFVYPKKPRLPKAGRFGDFIPAQNANPQDMKFSIGNFNMGFLSTGEHLFFSRKLQFIQTIYDSYMSCEVVAEACKLKRRAD